MPINIIKYIFQNKFLHLNLNLITFKTQNGLQVSAHYSTLVWLVVGNLENFVRESHRNHNWTTTPSNLLIQISFKRKTKHRLALNYYVRFFDLIS